MFHPSNHTKDRRREKYKHRKSWNELMDITVTKTNTTYEKPIEDDKNRHQQNKILP